MKIQKVRFLVIDAGNTLIKGALFENDVLIQRFQAKGKSIHDFVIGISQLPEMPACALVSSVRADTDTLLDSLKDLNISQVLSFRSGLKLPIKLMYKTPETLGTDRIANACMAPIIAHNTHCLIIDIGTCIKFDFVSNGVDYLGGSISPGVKIRYKGLSSFTGRLPYFKKMLDDFPDLIGASTEASIRSGVENGILSEINGLISAYDSRYTGLKIILTGGDAERFHPRLEKNSIFVDPDLTLKGLYQILKINA